jgi:glycosyltransferase involved in cell wall biosynthesis
MAKGEIRPEQLVNPTHACYPDDMNAERGKDKKKVLTICHIISGDLWAGAACQVSNLLSELIKNERFHCSAITFNRGRLTNELRELGMPVLCVPENENSPIEIIRHIRAQIIEKKVNIIHCHGHKEHILGCLARLAARRPLKVVRTLHGMPEPYYGLAGLRAKLSQKLQEMCSIFLTDQVIVVSSDMRERLKFQRWARKIVCIHNGINPEKVKAAMSADEMRKRLEISKTEFVIGTACRLVPIKRIDLLLETFSSVNRKHPHSLLLISGDGPLSAELKKKSKILGISERVRFLGHRDDLYDVMSVFDLFVMTSEHEGVPMVILEALTLGIPIVAPAVGGIPEILEGQQATLLDPLTRENLAEHILGEINKKTSSARNASGGRTVSFISAEQTATETALAYDHL